MTKTVMGFLLLISAVAFLFGTFVAGPGQEGERKETAFQRVMRIGTIRCGYTTWAPYFTLDPNTGEKGGIAFDLMNAVGKEMGVEIAWVEEVGWGNMHEGLNAKRYDAMCVPVWVSGARARIVLMTEPFYDNALYAYAREDDHRFDDGFEAANREDVTFVVVEGDVMQAHRRVRFPRAKELALPQIADESQALLSVAGRKADIALDNPFGVDLYNKAAKVKVRAIAGGKPVRLFANALAVKLGELEWKAALDSTIAALVKSGEIERIVRRYPGFLPSR